MNLLLIPSIVWSFFPVFIMVLLLIMYNSIERRDVYDFIVRHADVIVNWADAMDWAGMDEVRQMEQMIATVKEDMLTLGFSSVDNVESVIEASLLSAMRKRELYYSAIKGDLIIAENGE